MKKFDFTKKNIIIIMIIVLVSVLSSTITMVIMSKKVSNNNSKNEPKVVEKREESSNTIEEQTEETTTEETIPIEEKEEDTKTENTDVKKNNAKRTEIKKESSNNVKEVSSDKYVCTSGTLVQKDGNYYCMTKVSDGVVYSSPQQYYCKEGVTLKDKKCYETIVADAVKYYKCPDGVDTTKSNGSGKYIWIQDTNECKLKDESYYAVGESGCKSGFAYNSYWNCCLPTEDSACPSNHYVGQDGRCYAKPVFARYSCENYKNDNVTQNGTKCSWEMVYDANIK